MDSSRFDVDNFIISVTDDVCTTIEGDVIFESLCNVDFGKSVASDKVFGFGVEPTNHCSELFDEDSVVSRVEASLAKFSLPMT